MTAVQRNAARAEVRPVAGFARGTGGPRAQLTPKEQACLRLVAKHLSSKEIAAELGIAKTSVDTYCNRARAKLGVSDRYEAARRLVSDQDPADRHFRPAFAAGGPAPITTSQEFALSRGAAVKPHQRLRLTGVIVIVLAVTLAFATLLSGLRALEVMRPRPTTQQEAPAIAAQHGR